MLNMINTTNQSFSILPISSFEKNGPFAWPGTLEECSDLLGVAYFIQVKTNL